MARERLCCRTSSLVLPCSNPQHPRPTLTLTPYLFESICGACPPIHCPAPALQARKEFGKTKLYTPSQEGLAALDPAEAAQRHADIKRLQEECQGVDAEVAALRKGGWLGGWVDG